MEDSADLSIRLLGNFQFLDGMRPISAIRSRRLQALLAYLLLDSGQPIPRDRIASAFWPETTDAQARTNLRNLLHTLKEAFPRVDQYLSVDRQTLSWNPATPYRLDVAEFESAAIAADIAGLQVAAALYTGDLLPELYDDWVVAERERLRALYAATLERLAGLLAASGRYAEAAAAVERLLRLDPLDEARTIRLMQFHALNGDPAGVRRAYYSLAGVLREELSVEPDEETRVAYEEWRRYRPPASAPLASAIRRTNLPAQLTSFVGRADELAELVAALGAPDARLVTLGGEGGSGKTRLALQAADALRPAFPDGVWLVELDTLSDPALVPSAVASALGIVEDKSRPLLDSLVDFLAGRRAALLLDNCEHLVGAVATTAGRLLHHCPRLLILATSRERLGVSGETLWPVPAMALPPPYVTDPAELADYDAVRLFVERAAAALPGFALTPDNATAVAQVCRRLDGIPLALELAGARVRLLRVEQIAARLDDRFALLVGGDRATVPRQQTLRGLIDWSHDLLSLPEQRLLRQLSVFAGGFTLAAAEAVGDPESEGSVLDALEKLADKSLVAAGRATGREAHYSLHETIHHYSREKLNDAGETAATQSRHAAYYGRLLEDMLPRTDYDDRWFARLAWLEAEYANCSVVLSRALGTGAVDAAWGVRVAARLAPFWLMHGRLIEGRRWLEAALNRVDAAGLAVRAALTLWMATLMTREWDPQGNTLAARGVALFRELGDPIGTAWGLIVLSLSDLSAREAAATQLAEALTLAEAADDDCLQMGAHHVLARLALRDGSFDNAAAHGERALALARAAGNRLREPYLLRILGVIASWHGDSPMVTVRFEEALALARELNVQGWVQSHILNSMGEDARRRGDYDRALNHYRAALEVATRIGDQFLMMGEQLNIGLVLVRDGDGAEGEGLLHRDLRDRVRADLIDGNTVWNLWGLAVAAARRGDPERAAQLFSGAVRLSEATGFPVAPADRAAFDADIAATRVTLGEGPFASVWDCGGALTREELFAFALDK